MWNQTNESIFQDIKEEDLDMHEWNVLAAREIKEIDVICPVCRGCCMNPHTDEDCEECDGKGYVPVITEEE